MSIPLDRLYHYIESVAQEVYGDTIIYRFYPHGSKKIEDLKVLRNYPNNRIRAMTNPQIFCYDQEPLNYNHYTSIDLHQLDHVKYNKDLVSAQENANLNWDQYNLRSVPVGPINIYDQCILLHSEQRSENVKIYQQHGFIPVYYWSHAIIALDWFRYAQHQHQQKLQTTKSFLIYNRAWSGTREYRLKFADMLIDNKLVDQCRTSIGLTDNGVYYQNHTFTNPTWECKNQLEHYFTANFTSSCYSADFNLSDYEASDVEIVLETIFDDSRLHLTEKSLRPLACGQPFILCSTHGSLQYLKDYGFKTFHQVFDESYDNIVDPLERMQAVIKVMKEIANWSAQERIEKLRQLNKIAKYNQEYFFSKDFFNKVITELRTNLHSGLTLLETTNTGSRFIQERKLLASDAIIKSSLVNESVDKPRQETAYILAQARKYYNKYLAKSK